MLPAVEILAENVRTLLRDMKRRPPRPKLAEKIGIGDKTLGFIKAGTGNPTLENIEKVAVHFRVKPWQLLKEDGLLAESSPASQPPRPDFPKLAGAVYVLRTYLSKTGGEPDWIYDPILLEHAHAVVDEFGEAVTPDNVVALSGWLRRIVKGEGGDGQEQIARVGGTSG